MLVSVSAFIDVYWAVNVNIYHIETPVFAVWLCVHARLYEFLHVFSHMFVGTNVFFCQHVTWNFVQPKARCTSGFLVSDCRIFKDRLNHSSEHCVILLKCLTHLTVWCVNTLSALSHNVTTLRPHNSMYFDQVRALPHIHYILGSW